VISKFTKKHTSFLFVALGVILLSIIVNVNLVQRARQARVSKAFPGGPDIYFQPSQKTVSKGATNQTYDIYINTNGYNVSAASIEVTPSSSDIQFTNMAPGEALPVQLAKNVTSSIARIDLGSQPSTPFNGTGRVAIVSFNAANVDTTVTISFTGSTQVAAVGISGNVLGNTTNGVVVVGSPTTE
jgi:hypothetical protein